MYIVHLAAEAAPIAKVGGLADATFGLSLELKRMGHDVEIFIPCYYFLKEQEEPHLFSSFDFSIQGKVKKISIYTLKKNGTSIFLLDIPGFFSEKTIYLGGDKDALRLTYFSQVALEFLLLRKKPVDILQLHDWHTSVAAPLYRDIFQERGLKIKAITLNIHNLCYQGKASKKLLQEVGLSKFTIQKGIKKRGLLQKPYLLIFGIKFSDRVITVSPSYAKEILTPKYSCGLLSILRKERRKISGIINGIDHELWNPETDKSLVCHYKKEDPIDKIIEAKHKNRLALGKLTGLRLKKGPLVAVISRLVAQKSPELIQDGLLYTLKKGGQAILLGSSPTKEIQKSFEKLKSSYRNNPDIHFHFEYDDSLSRLIYAAADFVLMPSEFEPCGITQLIALRYGTIPIVRKTGGLKDTVLESQNGYLFPSLTKSSMRQALKRAFKDHELQRHNNLIIKGMDADNSWRDSAKKYLTIYEDTIADRTL